jgi:hypothetical protein
MMTGSLLVVEFSDGFELIVPPLHFPYVTPTCMFESKETSDQDNDGALHKKKLVGVRHDSLFRNWVCWPSVNPSVDTLGTSENKVPVDHSAGIGIVATQNFKFQVFL